MTDDDLNRRLDRTRRKLARLERRDRNPDRAARLRRRITKFEGWLALPVDQRPRRVKLSAGLIRSALGVASAALAATPAGPILAGLVATVSAGDRIAKAVARDDASEVEDSVAALVEERLRQAGLTEAQVLAALAVVENAVEDAVDGEGPAAA